MKILAQILVVVGFLNFLSFFVAALILGGDALNGKIDGQKYYLGSHGHYTEVSQPVFEYSRFHARSVLVTHPLMFVGAGIYAWHRKRRGSQPERFNTKGINR